MRNFPQNVIEQTELLENNSDSMTISLLINSIYFFLQCVFIIKVNNCYRLVALQNGRVLTDITYQTLRGARIAFSKLYGHKAWEKDMKAEWSHFYDPDLQWLEEKTSLD